MKNFKFQIILICALIFFTKSLGVQTIFATTYFDKYRNDISWDEQKAHLENFAYFLKKNPEMIGYIAFFRTKNESSKNFKAHTEKSVKYLTRKISPENRIEINRIVIIDAGISEESETILQPFDKKQPRPNFNL